MSRFLGIDLGTSAAKVIVVDEDQAVRAMASEPIATSRPGPLASEQDPEDWWRAVEAALDRLGEHPREMAGVEAVGLSGEMHAALLLGPSDRPLRPAILWNDGLAGREADELKAMGMDLARRMGVPAMTGFTAPKLCGCPATSWATLRDATSLLLPKDFIRFRLTGERATDVPTRRAPASRPAPTVWDDEAIAAVGLNGSSCRRLVEGTDRTREVRPTWPAGSAFARASSSPAGRATRRPAASASARSRRGGDSSRSAPRPSSSSPPRPIDRPRTPGPCVLPRRPGPLVPDGRDAQRCQRPLLLRRAARRGRLGRLLDEAEAGPDRPSP